MPYNLIEIQALLLEMMAMIRAACRYGVLSLLK